MNSIPICGQKMIDFEDGDGRAYTDKELEPVETPAQSLRNLSHAAFEAALGWKLMYHVCGEPRQFWAWQDELELAFVLAERARVEEAGVVLLPTLASSLHYKSTPLADVLDQGRFVCLWL